MQGLQITLMTALFDLSAVLWANYVGTQAIPNASDMDRFSMAHVAHSATTLWVHLASVALKTVIVLVMLYRVRLIACRDGAVIACRAARCTR